MMKIVRRASAIRACRIEHLRLMSTSQQSRQPADPAEEPEDSHEEEAPTSQPREQQPQEESVIEKMKKKFRAATETSDAEISRLKTEVDNWRKECARIQADAYNHAERLKEQKKSASTYAIRKFAKDLLPVVDVLEKAVGQDNVTKDQLLEGVKLTQKDFLRVLESHNVKRMPCEGIFNPNMHEVVYQQPHEKPTGTIINVLTEGYTIGEQTLRGAKVGISSGPPDGA